MSLNVLGIETSCDDTSAAVVERGPRVLSCVVSGQDEFHEKYGGVVPEIASRRHIEVIDLVVKEAIFASGLAAEDLSGVAVTSGPGLIGSLLVGLNYAKGFAFARGLPFVGVNHVEAHLFAARLGDRSPDPPFVGLVVSGGHTNLYLVEGEANVRLLGKTLDDAAGECFDKVAKLLGLGYPGGAAIDRLAKKGDPEAVSFPRPMLTSENLSFSFSGLKTAVRKHLLKRDRKPEGKELFDIAAGFNAAVAEVLVAKLFRAARFHDVGRVVLAGGVAANTMLRSEAAKQAESRGIELFIPDLQFCTDNAAMIAAAGMTALFEGRVSPWSLNAYASLAGCSGG